MQAKQEFTPSAKHHLAKIGPVVEDVCSVYSVFIWI